MIGNSEIDAFLQSIDENRSAIIQSLFKEDVIKKGTLMLSEGKICTKNFILRNGVARKYFFHLEKEITTEIYLKGDIAFSFESFTFQKKANENIVAVTDLKCFTIDYKDYIAARTNYDWFVEY